MSESADQQNDQPTKDADNRNDPLMTLFIAGIVLLLLLCVIFTLVANSRPPAGL